MNKYGDYSLANPAEMEDWQKYLFDSQQQSTFNPDQIRQPHINWNFDQVEIYLKPSLVRELIKNTQAICPNIQNYILAVLYGLLQRYTHQTDILVGTFIPAVSERLLPLRIQGDMQSSFLTLLSIIETHISVLKKYTHYNINALINNLDIKVDKSYHPLFQIAVIDNAQLDNLQYLEISNKMDLTLAYQETPDGIKISFRYATELYDRITLERLAEHFLRLTESISLNVEKPIYQLDLMSLQERLQLQDWNSTDKNYQSDKCIHQLFEDQVLRSPNAIAVEMSGITYSFADLNINANQLAHFLQHSGVSKGMLVGIHMRRSIDMITSILAIFKAGAAYVPLDPDYPIDRIVYMLEDSRVEVLLTHNAVNENQFSYTGKLINVDRDKTLIQQESESNLNTPVSENDLAYVLYTSGSTGKPKGVMGIHQGAINRFSWMWERFPFVNTDVCCQKTSLNFVDSIWEMFGPLLKGVKLIIADSESAKDSEKLLDLVAAQRITQLVLVPSLLQAILDSNDNIYKLASIKRIVVSGEWLSTALVAQFFEKIPSVKLLNLYGSTEVSADATYYEVSPADSTKQFIPIGKPLFNNQVFILTESGGEVAIGQIGEIFVGGHGLARGYWGQPELTAKSFQTISIFGKERRLYKTGDKGRYLSNGEIEFIGRADNQVKLRGIRIEIGEIEAALQNLPEVHTAVVLLNRPNSGYDRLEAYIVCKDDFNNEKGLYGVNINIRQELAKKLPNYMIPSQLFYLKTMPLTPNGKINKMALPSCPRLTIKPHNIYTAARDEIEEKMVAIWLDLSGLGKIGVFDNIYSLGANSLSLIKYRRLISEKLHVNLTLEEIFKVSTIAELADIVRHNQGKFLDTTAISFNRDEIDNEASYVQKSMWLQDQLTNEKQAYNIAYRLRFSAKLDIGALRQAWKIVVSRHEILRTNLVLNKDSNKLIQVINHDDTFVLQEYPVVIASDEELTKQDNLLAHSQFNLETDRLFKVALFSCADGTFSAVVVAHHSIIDGISAKIIFEELGLYYSSLVSDTPSHILQQRCTYVEYATWQRQHLLSKKTAKQLEYWTKQLSGIPESINFLNAQPRGAVSNLLGETYSFNIDGELLNQFKVLCAQEKVTLFTGLLTLFHILLHWYSNQEEVVIGFPVAGRHYADIEKSVGVFINTLPLRLPCKLNDSFRKILNDNLEIVLEAYEHQDVPFEHILNALQVNRDLSYHPIFQVMFSYEQFSEKIPTFLDFDVTVSELPSYGAKFDLTLNAIEKSFGIELNFEYSTQLFSHETIVLMAAHFNRLLEKIVYNPNESVIQHEIISDYEKSVMKQFDNIPSCAPADSLLDLFTRQALLQPEAIALDDDGETITYGDLNNRANRLAHYLLKSNSDKHQMIAVCLPKSINLIVTILAVWKIGGCYIPIDPKFPAQRIGAILSEIDNATLITLSGMSFDATKLACSVLNYDHLQDQINAFSDKQPLQSSSPDDLAYIIYTSGSTGIPKGVMVSHNNMMNACYGWKSVYLLDQLHCHLQMAGHTFDVFVGDLIRSLSFGAKLVLCQQPDLLNPEKIYNLLVAHNIDFAEFVPATIRSLMSYLHENSLLLPSTLKIIACGSDTWTINDCLALQKLCPANIRIINSYGLTECTIDSTFYEFDATVACQFDGDKPLPLGKPFVGTRLRILNKEGRDVPLGVAGELYISGHGVSQGYFKRPKMNQERFLRDNHLSMYRTGDLVRCTPSGIIEYLGRADLQIKLRGYRIDLGEIEQCILKHPRVAQAVVIVHEMNNAKHLVCYIVLNDSNQDVEANEILDFLSHRLPSYMLPSFVVKIKNMPLTTNGKVDRKALPLPIKELIKDGVKPQKARTLLQEALCEIWQEILRIDSVGLHDEFFKMGGDSILCIQMVSRAKRLGIEFSVQDIFRGPTIAQIASVAKQIQAINIVTDCVRYTSNKFPLLPIQTWFFSQRFSEFNHWNQSIVLDIKDNVNFEFVRDGILYLFNQHEQLRAIYSYSEPENCYQQKILHVEECSDFIANICKKHIVTHVENTLENTLNEIAYSMHRSLDIHSGKLIQAGFIETQAGKSNILIVVVHHLAIDGVSWRILADDLQFFLQSALSNTSYLNRGSSTSYQQWALELSQYANSDACRQEFSYWENLLQREVVGIPIDFKLGLPSVSTANAMSFSLSVDSTRKLIYDTPKAYNTHINDILLCALILAVKNVTGQLQLSLMLEGHGREDLIDKVDLSRTVGWFTSEFPVCLELSSTALSNTAECIKSIKEQLRKIPRKGIGYGILKYMSKDNQVSSKSNTLREPEISFNYLGQWDAVDSADNIVTISSFADKQCVSPLNSRNYLLEIESQVINGMLSIEFLYCSNHYTREKIELLLSNYAKELNQLIEHCVRPENYGCTLSDFPNLRITENILQTIATVAKAKIDDIYHVTPLQNGMLTRYHFSDKKGEYVVQSVFNLQGKWSESHLYSSWISAVNRFPVLRSGFYVGSFDADPYQYVIQSNNLAWTKLNWSDIDQSQASENLQRLLHADRESRYDLANPPLLRIYFIEIDTNHYQLVFSHHHIILDGWSTSVLFEFVFHTYLNILKDNKPDLTVDLSFKNHISFLNNCNVDLSRKFWRENLAGANPSLLELSNERSDSDNSLVEAVEFSTSRYITQRLHDIEKKHGLTSSSIFQSVLTIVLNQYLQTNDLIFGVVVSGRAIDTNTTDIDSAVGLLACTLPLRVKSANAESFIQLSHKVQNHINDISQHSSLTLSEIMSLASGGTNEDIFNVLFVYENYPQLDLTELSQLGLSYSEVNTVEKSEFPLVIMISPMDDFKISVLYHPQSISKSAAQQLSESFEYIVKTVAQFPEIKLGQIGSLSPINYDTVITKWNSTQLELPASTNMLSLFERQALQGPTQIALRCNNTEISYAELNAQANRLARYLLSMGINRESHVLVCMDKSIDTIIVILGILKSGGVYVPVDPTYPSSRINYILQDANPSMIFTQTDYCYHFQAQNARIIVRDQWLQELCRFSANNTPISLPHEALAYIIYTSGSTGNPKGVMVEHGGLVNLLVAQVKKFEIHPETRLLQFASLSFDAAISEIGTALISGATLVIPTNTQLVAGDNLEDILISEKITVVTLPPTILATINTIGFLKTLVVAGEAPAKPVLDRWCEQVKIINAYGPTEITVCASTANYNKQLPVATIGKPIDNTYLYIANSELQPLPIGVVGELFIGGIGVARGYLNRPALNQERFLINPYATKEDITKKTHRLYRTGDLARFLPDGNIEYLGRADNQIKIRGFRVELGEIESVLHDLEIVKEAVVIATGEYENRVLTAFIVCKNLDSSLDLVEIILAALKKKLPGFMLPSSCVFLDNLPLNANGKIDRNALSATHYHSQNTQELDASKLSPIEYRLAQIWKKLLRVASVNGRDNFLRLGGNSLLIVQLRFNIREIFSVDMGISALLKHVNLIEMAQGIEKLRMTQSIAELGIQRIKDKGSQIPLSFSQKRFWLLDRILSGLSYIYNIPLVYEISGELNVEALNNSINTLAARHESLRTQFITGDDGHVYQHINRNFKASMNIVDVRDAEDMDHHMRQEISKGFAIEETSFRVTLLRLPKNRAKLIFNMHHIIFDEHSTNILCNELNNIYSAYCRNTEIILPQLAVNYTDYSLWQVNESTTERFQQKEAYWLQQLAHLPEPIELPCSKSRPDVRSYQGCSFDFTLDSDVTAKLHMIASHHQATLFMVMLACLDVLLYRYSGQADIVIGTPFSGRTYSHLDSLIGCFINTLAIRVRLNDKMLFSDLLNQVSALTVEAYDNSDVPFESLVEKLNVRNNINISSVFQIMFLMESRSTATLNLENLTCSPVNISSNTAKYDLIFSAQETQNGQIKFTIEYNTDIFDEVTIARMSEHYRVIVSNITLNPQQKIVTIPYLSQAEYNCFLPSTNLLDATYPANTLVGWFEQQAYATPNKIAVKCEDEFLSYRSLNLRSDQIANFLTTLGVRPEVLVCLCVERSIDMIVTILGILKAGGAYVPIEPTNPQERIDYVLSDTQATVLLTQEKFKSRFEHYSGKIVILDDPNNTINTYPSVKLNIPLQPNHLAYVIYTSGSTGKPKGVLITHHNVCRLFAQTQNYYHFTENDVWSMFHSYAFDFSVWEMWGALIYGGRLAIVPYLTSRSPNLFYQFLQKEGVTVLNQTPSAFQQLITHESDLQTIQQLQLRYIIFGGEALNPIMLSPWFDRHGDQNPKVINMYGITETTVHVTFYQITAETLNKKMCSIIGRQIPDLVLYILDNYHQPVSYGVTGELYVGGPGVARGYLNRPELTDQRFIPNPFVVNDKKNADARLYRTGDLARYLPDGNIEYLGRIDTQVKIRGYRIELGEIESTILGLNLVKEVAVVAIGEAEHKRLVAYMIAKMSDMQYDAKSKLVNLVRDSLLAKLPHYMVPSAYEFLAVLPLNVNGKLDRQSLPAPNRYYDEHSAPATKPQNTIQYCLHTIWCQLLKNDSISIHDDFFNLGGNSMLAAQVVAKGLKDGLNINLKQLLENPTIAKLAATITTPALTKQTNEFSTIQFINDESPYALTAIQEMMVRNYGNRGKELGIYHSQISYHLEHNSYSPPAFKQALTLMVNKHPCFRTRFINNNNVTMQYIKNAVDITIAEVDLSDNDESNKMRVVEEFMINDRTTRFDIFREDQNCFRFALFRLSKNQFVFFLSLHHAIEDGWGVVEFLKDLFTAYLRIVKDLAADIKLANNVHRWYVTYENSLISSAEHSEFWARHLKGLQCCMLDRIPVSEQDDNKTVNIILASSQQRKLSSLGKSLQVNEKSVYLSAFFDLLAERYGHTANTIGVVCNAGRTPEVPESIESLGLYWSILPCSTNVIENKLEQIKKIHRQLITLESYAAYPYAKVIPTERFESLFYATFNFINFHNERELPGEIKVISVTGHDKFHYPLNIAISVDSQNDIVELRIDYANDNFKYDEVKKMADDYCLKLTRLCPDIPDNREVVANLAAAAIVRNSALWNKPDENPARLPLDNQQRQAYDSTVK